MLMDKIKAENEELNHLWLKHKISLAKHNTYGKGFLAIGYRRDPDKRVTVQLFVRYEHGPVRPLCELTVRGVTKLIILLTSILRDLVFCGSSRELQEVIRDRVDDKDVATMQEMDRRRWNE